MSPLSHLLTWPVKNVRRFPTVLPGNLRTTGQISDLSIASAVYHIVVYHTAGYHTLGYHTAVYYVAVYISIMLAFSYMQR